MTEIHKLKKEAEVYNNPQNYVRYVKLERQISKLQKEYEANLTKFEAPQSNDSQLMDSLPSISYPYLIINILFYIAQFVLIFMLRGHNFTFKLKENQKSNIIFNYFLQEDLVSIPIYLIIIAESVFLHKATNIISKIF